MNKLIAIVLCTTLLFSLFTIIPATANDSEIFAYAETLNAETGNAIFNYDFSKDSAPDSATGGDNGNTWITTSTAFGQKALYFQYGDWSDEGRKAAFNIGRDNFAARITIAVDNAYSKNQSGTFRVYTYGNGGYASCMQIGLPDRSSNDPKAGSVRIYNETAQYSYDNYGSVTPFTANSTQATFTFEIYCYEGTIYYVKEDGTLIGSKPYKTGVTLDESTYIKLTCGYGEAWVTGISAYELNEKAPVVVPTFTYAEKIDAVTGDEVFSYDFATDSAPKSATEGDNGNTWINTSTAFGQKALYFQYGNWADEGRKAAFNVGRDNFAARITVAVDNAISNSQSGTFRIFTVGNGGTASYMHIGLPDRSSNAPTAGAVNVYNQNAQYGFNTYYNVTPFTADSTQATFTLEIYCFDGTIYYVKEDGTLIGSQPYKTGVTLDESTYIKLTCGYGEAWVTEIAAVALEAKPVFTYAENLNATLGDEIFEYDFSKDSAPDSATGGDNGNTWITTSTAFGQKALYFKYENWADECRKAAFNIGRDNFAARITIAVDNTISSNQSGTFRIFTVGNGGTASYMHIGLPDRSSNAPTAGAVNVYNQNTQYGFNTYYNVTPFTAGSTQATFTFEMYCLNGTVYYTTEDGTLIGSAPYKTGVALDESTYIKLTCGYGEAWVTEISAKALKPIVVKELIEDSGFIAGEPYYSTNFADGSEGWNLTGASVGNGTADSASKSVLKLANEWGSSSAAYELPFKNFAATVTVGIDYAQKLSGILHFGVKDSSGTTASYWGLGLPKRDSSQTLKAGKSLINNGSANSNYKYPAAGAYEYITDGYTTVKMIMYLYNGVFYYYWADGTFVGSIDANSTCDLNSGNIKLYFANDYGIVYLEEVKIFEIVPNTFEAGSVNLTLENGNPVVNFNMSFDTSFDEVIPSEDMQFGAVVTFNDTAVTTNTTVDTEDSIIWEFENGTTSGDLLKFTKQFAVSSDMLDKYINVRTFVILNEIYSYVDAVSYCPAQLADVAYRSTVDSAEKQAIETAFAASNTFHGAESKKLTFTAFSDFHYKQGMYISSIGDMNTIFERANASGSSFVVSAGDMCNDFVGSPELVNAFKNNRYGITAANVYGNHELESSGNSMEVVTNTLTNAQNVVWGTADGSYNSSIGYYYFDAEGFRIICTDTNYSWNASNSAWEHNKTSTYGPASGNTKVSSLGDVQKQWLSDLLYDAAENDIPCVVVSHAAFKTNWDDNSSDSAEIMKLFDDVNAVNPGTVMMQVSGHAHDDKLDAVNGVVYFRVNTTRNSYWQENAPAHYDEDDYFMMETYDSKGNFLGYEKTLLSSLSAGSKTYFSDAPVSATVTIDECGIITIDGVEANWFNGIGVSNPSASTKISDFATFNCESGHVWTTSYTVEDDVHYIECIHPNCTITEKSENALYGEHAYENGECVCGKKSDVGDVDANGVVDMNDVIMLRQILIGSKASVPAADVNKDGYFDICDLVLLNNKFA